MSKPKQRWCLLPLLVAAMAMWATPARACLFDWLWPSSPSSTMSSATTYAPPYSAQRVSYLPATSGVSASYMPTAQTCYYTPETSYRWTYSRITSTSYRPVTTFDPCSGQPVTVHQPVTTKSLLPWLHREPYTTYRLTCTNAGVACPSPSVTCSPSCVTCPTSTFGSAPSSPSCAPVTVVPDSASSTSDPGYEPRTYKRPADSSESPSEENGPALQGPTPDLNNGPASLRKPQRD